VSRKIQNPFITIPTGSGYRCWTEQSKCVYSKNKNIYTTFFLKTAFYNDFETIFSSQWFEGVFRPRIKGRGNKAKPSDTLRKVIII
jgi:hypothetical protein